MVMEGTKWAAPRDSEEYLRKLSRLVLLEKVRRECEMIGQLQLEINERETNIEMRRNLIFLIQKIVKEKEAAEESDPQRMCGGCGFESTRCICKYV